jgi:thiamine biosynthesis lipoprotein
MTRVEHVMGMAVSIDVRGVDAGTDDAVADVVRWLHWVDATFSTFKETSPVSMIARGELSTDDAPAEVREILGLAAALAGETRGYFDIRAGGRLDPSGVVKGWAVERASAALAAAGCTSHCVNAGGDIRVRGGPWRIGIAHPLVRDALTSVVELTDGAVATSGTAERGLHIIDPHTARPAIELASVTVVGPDLAVADAYATAAMAMGLDAPGWLDGLTGYSAYVVDAGGRAWCTPGFGRETTRPCVGSGRP